MGAKIRILSEKTINQIAAGEVIENPGSVVKELIENALDAGASTIRLAISGGGRQLIRVADDGSGMSPDDALLSVERHATSKLIEASDLSDVETMGFRGEALAAIAAVSQFALISSEGEVGTRVAVSGGKLQAQGSAAHPRGTTIEVRSLFFNAPVRRRFQKSINQDVRAINRSVLLAALANPQIGFVLKSGDKEVLQVSPDEGLKQRIRKLLGGEFADHLLTIQAQGEGVTLSGFIAEPPISRAGRQQQYLFINRRPVVSRLVSDAVREAYGMTLPTSRHPCFVLHLDLSGESVDVNVHPQKREVRFQDEARLRSFVFDAIASALHRPPPQAPSKAMPTYRPPTELPTLRAAEETAPYKVAEQTLVKPAPEVLGLVGPYILLRAEEGLRIVDSTRLVTRLRFDSLMRSQESAPSQSLLVPVTIDLTADELSIVCEYNQHCGQIGIGLREFGGNTIVIDALPPFVAETDVAQLLHDLIGSLQTTGKADLKSAKERLALAIARQSARRFCLGSPDAAMRLIQEWQNGQSITHTPTGEPILVHLSVEEIEGRFRRATH